MKNSFRLLLILIAIGGGLNTAEAQPVPLRLSYGGLGGGFSPPWMAKELGLFDRHELQISMIYIASVGLPAMLAGETDFQAGAIPPSIQARLSGADITILATWLNRVQSSIMARPTIGQPADLRGKRVGIGRFGSITDFLARIALKRWGLVPVRDVAIIQLGGVTEIYGALQAGVVEAAVLPPPFSTEAKRLGMVELLNPHQSDLELALVGLTSTTKYVNAHPETTRRVIRALVEGIWAFKADRDAALRTLVKYTRITDRKVLEETYQQFRDELKLIPRTTDAGVSPILDVLADDDPAARAAKPRDFFDARFIDELEQTGFMRELAARYPGALR